MTRQKKQENYAKKQQQKTREEIGKGNQMTALRFQTGGRHHTSLAYLRGICMEENIKEAMADIRPAATVDSMLHTQSQ